MFDLWSQSDQMLWRAENLSRRSSYQRYLRLPIPETSNSLPKRFPPGPLVVAIVIVLRHFEYVMGSFNNIERIVTNYLHFQAYLYFIGGGDVNLYPFCLK